MIQITADSNSLTIDGHAGYAPKGQDIVCEAVTVLVQTFLASVEELTETVPEHDIRAGHFYVHTADLEGDSRLLLDALMIGLEMVANAYSEFVTLSKH